MATPRIRKLALAFARARRMPEAGPNQDIASAVRAEKADDFNFRPPANREPYDPVGGLPKIPCAYEAFEWTLLGWPVRNEGEYNNCVSFAAIACLEYLLARDGMAGPALSPQSLVHAIKTKTGKPGECDPHPHNGYTYLRWAYDALRNVGVCTEAEFPYAGDVAAPPPHDPRPMKYKNLSIVYRDQLYKSTNTLDAAAAVYACLRANRQPVAICLPLFADPTSNGRYPTNWTTDDAQHHGLVGEPPRGAEPQGGEVIGNHCVTMTGFIPTKNEPNGGYFIFRNCGGTQIMGRFAPSTLPGITAPRPGYGVISATYVKRYCLEFLQLLP